MGRAARRGVVERALPERVGRLWHSSSTVRGKNGKFRYHWKSPRFARKVVSLCRINGGGAWESNPPTALFARHAGFEVQELPGTNGHHQTPSDNKMGVWGVPETAIVSLGAVRDR